MMMPPPQVVGVLLKKPGQQTHPRLPPLDQQETKIRGESHRRRAISFGSLSSLCVIVCPRCAIFQCYWTLEINSGSAYTWSFLRPMIAFARRSSLFPPPRPPPSSCSRENPSRKVITHSSDRMLLFELPRKMNPLL